MHNESSKQQNHDNHNNHNSDNKTKNIRHNKQPSKRTKGQLQRQTNQNA
jgi:hypothetical protein